MEPASVAERSELIAEKIRNAERTPNEAAQQTHRRVPPELRSAKIGGTPDRRGTRSKQGNLAWVDRSSASVCLRHELPMSVAPVGGTTGVFRGFPGSPPLYKSATSELLT